MKTQDERRMKGQKNEMMGRNAKEGRTTDCTDKTDEGKKKKKERIERGNGL
jgi:hypothetical protein